MTKGAGGIAKESCRRRRLGREEREREVGVGGGESDVENKEKLDDGKDDNVTQQRQDDDGGVDDGSFGRNENDDLAMLLEVFDPA